jgi:hypothetical protein
MRDNWAGSAQSPQRNAFDALSFGDLSTACILLQQVDALLHVDLRHVSPQEDGEDRL